ncbi:hypothetical protein AVEN_77284-1, partial [Araneus ventricosus]
SDPVSSSLLVKRFLIKNGIHFVEHQSNHGGMNKEWVFLSFPIGASEVTVRGAAAILVLPETSRSRSAFKRKKE